MASGRKTGGRQKGTPNKTSADVKAAILGAFSQAGGVDYLAKVAEEDPRTFCTLLGKVLPMQVTGAEGGPLRIQRIERVIVDPQASDPPRLRALAGGKPV